MSRHEGRAQPGARGTCGSTTAAGSTCNWGDITLAWRILLPNRYHIQGRERPCLLYPPLDLYPHLPPAFSSGQPGRDATLFPSRAPDPPPTAGRITLQAESDTQAVWLTYVRKHTSRPLATAMPQALATRPSSRACWRVKIHMPLGTHVAPSRVSLRACTTCRAWGVATMGTAILARVGGRGDCRG